MLASSQQADHKTVLITGAAKRIGRALSLALAEDGWAVAVHYNASAEDAEKLVGEITQADGTAIALQADLADAHAVENLLPQAIEALGPMTALINNASRFEPDSADDFTIDDWNAHVDINLRAPALLMRDFSQQNYWQQDRQYDGCIINLSDQRVLRPVPDFISYSVSKAGLSALTISFAQSLAAKHIRVNAIAPGPTLPSGRQSKANFDKQSALVPLRHGASPDDIVRAARYLLASPAVTGQTLTVDGGQHIAWQTPDVTETKE